MVVFLMAKCNKVDINPYPMDENQYLKVWLALGVLLIIIGGITGKSLLVTFGTVLIFVKAMSWYWDRNATIS